MALDIARFLHNPESARIREAQLQFIRRRARHARRAHEVPPRGLLHTPFVVRPEQARRERLLAEQRAFHSAQRDIVASESSQNDEPSTGK